MVKKQPTRVTADLNHMLSEYGENPLDTYYDYRDKWNQGLKDPAIFLFLKQTAFNGLWRENKSGGMNAPWGRYKSPSVPNPVQFTAWCLWLQKAVLRCQSFDRLMKRARSKDLVYFDPPYFGAFNSFSAKGFSEEDHSRLINFCIDLSNEGVHVVYSNVNRPEVVTLVKRWRRATRGVSFSVSSFQDGRYISGYTKAREPKEELLVVAKAK
jgi:DNA adenine methylase Dam